MNPTTPDKFTESPALVLLYFCSWTEKESGTDTISVRKGSDFSLSDRLKEGFVAFRYIVKSLYPTRRTA